MSLRSPDARRQNPITGSTIDTSAQALGLHDDRPKTPPPQTSNALKLSTSPRSVIKWTGELTAATAAKLSGTVLGTGKRDKDGHARTGSSPSRSVGRFLSLSRKGKGKDLGGSITDWSGGGAIGEGAYVLFPLDLDAFCSSRPAWWPPSFLCPWQSASLLARHSQQPILTQPLHSFAPHTPLAQLTDIDMQTTGGKGTLKRPTLAHSLSSPPSTLQTSPDDDSPFIRPRSPTQNPLHRSSIDAFRDFGSVSALVVLPCIVKPLSFTETCFGIYPFIVFVDARRHPNTYSGHPGHSLDR